MSNIKMIALDLDGTTLTSEKIITPRTQKALRAAMEKGINVVIATGRVFAALPEEILNEEGIEYHIVYYYVGEFDLIDNTYIHHYNRDREYLDTLKITLSGEDKELIKLMCNNYKEIY